MWSVSKETSSQCQEQPLWLRGPEGNFTPLQTAYLLVPKGEHLPFGCCPDSCSLLQKRRNQQDESMKPRTDQTAEVQAGHQSIRKRRLVFVCYRELGDFVKMYNSLPFMTHEIKPKCRWIKYDAQFISRQEKRTAADLEQGWWKAAVIKHSCALI